MPNVESLAFTYDADDQIIGIVNGNNAASQTLSYDLDGRLTGESSTADHESYAYDADGNRIAQVINGTTTNFTYATGSNQLIATTGGAGLANSYGYDANGNTTTLNGLTAYSYGPFNRLVNASGASFVISAEGQRLGKSFAGNTTYFAPDSSGALLAEDDAGNWHDNVWLNGRLVEVISGGKVYSVASDQTGRPVALTDPGTAVVWQATGLPFDRTVTSNTFGDFNIGFPGQYHDAESGLWHNGYRDYDAATGRYIQSDPIGLGGGVNTYAYVGGNPITAIDPWGLCPCNRIEQAAGALAKQAEKVGDAAGNYSIAAGAFALGEGGLGVVSGNAPMVGSAVAVGAAAEVSGNISEGASLGAGALNFVASGGDGRYLLRAALNSFLSRMGGKFASVIPGIGSEAEKFASSAIGAKLAAWKALPPPCDQP